MIKKSLTEKQKALLFDMEKYLESLGPSQTIEAITLTEQQYKEWLKVVDKVEKYPTRITAFLFLTVITNIIPSTKPVHPGLDIARRIRRICLYDY